MSKKDDKKAKKAEKNKKQTTPEVKYKVELVGRLSYPQIWTPKAFEEGKDLEFQASLLLDLSVKKDLKQIKKLKAVADVCLHDKFGKTIPKLKSRCYGTEKDLTKVPDGYADMFWIRVKRKAEFGRPVLVGSDNSPLLAEDNKLYAGCIIRMTLELWAQEHAKWGNRLNGTLRGIRFVQDNEAFGQMQPIAANEFSSEEEEDIDSDSVLD